MHLQTSTLTIVVALTCLCCSLQIAQPLATTSYHDDYDAPRLQQQHAATDTLTDAVGVAENLLQQHHVRHRTSHHIRKSAHHSRHNRQPHIEQAGGSGTSETSVDTAASSPAAASDEATESLNFLHASHLQKQQHKPLKFGAQYEPAQRLHLQHQKFYGEELEMKPNSIHTHLHHKHHAQKSRTTTTATTTMATTNNNTMPIAYETTTTVETMELVKPTSHPTKSAERNTIKLDEVNKGTQNYYNQQPIIHLKQQQQQSHQQSQQQQHQVHYKHHKLQPAADLSRSKHTVTSFHWDQPPLPPAHKTHNKLVHAGSQINVDTDDGEDNVSAKTLEQPDAVAVGGGDGGGKENKTTKLSSESASGLTTEADPRSSSNNSSSDKAIDYATETDDNAVAAADADGDDDDDGIEYYDYAVDDESTAAEQHKLAAPDIDGFSYGGYDSGIDGIEADWYASNLENEHHHRHHKQQQQQMRDYQEQLQRRQQRQWQAQELQHRHHERQHQLQQQHLHHYQQQKQQQYEYEIKHLRVARDHHGVQAKELQSNNLAYDTSSDDSDYPDDEPGRDSDEPDTGVKGELTKQKNTLGTREGVEEAHQAYRQRHYMRLMAQDHINRMRVPTACRWPLPRVVPVSNYTSVTYNPQYTILYRCGEDTGCCRSKRQVCTMAEYKNVTLYFAVDSVNSSNSHYGTLELRNHTLCKCENRSELASRSDSLTRGKRSDFAYAPRINYNPDAGCRCPREFDVYQDIRWQSLRQRHEMRNPYAPRTYNCRCDCEDTNTACQRFKNGDEGFAMDDRSCIAERICSVPNCSLGIYNKQTGRCPSSNRKLKRHNSGFG